MGTCCPPEIWHEIFALACTDTGSTGRSLSLVSKQFHDISGPFKYQSLAITQCRQLIAFAPTFSQLPDFQKKIKYLFIHFPYPFLDVEDDPKLANDSLCLQYFERYPSYNSRTDEEYQDSDSDYVTESDSESDSEFDSDEEQEVIEEEQYLRSVCEGSIPTEGNARDDESVILDDNIQVIFDQAIQALHAILNNTSSTLKILTLYWTSFRPLPVHDLLPPLPFLDELHLYRCFILSESLSGPLADDLSITTLFPRLRLLFMSGDPCHRRLSTSLAIIAPNLTHFRFTRVTYQTDL
jgi:hypothetical protein